MNPTKYHIDAVVIYRSAIRYSSLEHRMEGGDVTYKYMLVDKSDPE